jgi:hypothetical protein
MKKDLWGPQTNMKIEMVYSALSNPSESQKLMCPGGTSQMALGSFTRIGPSFYDIYLKTHILRSHADGGVNRKDGIIASSKLNPRDFK